MRLGAPAEGTGWRGHLGAWEELKIQDVLLFQQPRQPCLLRVASPGLEAGAVPGKGGLQPEGPGLESGTTPYFTSDLEPQGLPVTWV